VWGFVFFIRRSFSEGGFWVTGSFALGSIVASHTCTDVSKGGFIQSNSRFFKNLYYFYLLKLFINTNANSNFMTTSEFKIAWAQYSGDLRPISIPTLEKFNLSPSTMEFLNLSGLPEDAAPFLSFVSDTDSKNKYDSIDFLTNWFDFLSPEYSKYIVIGSDGCGDIIALNTDEDCIVEWLDHEDGFSPRFMNTSVLHLANCLAIYNQFIGAIKKENGEDAYMDANFSKTQFETLYDLLKSIDGKSVTEGFWQTDLDALIAQRDGLK